MNKAQTQDSMPTSKVARASQFVKAGVKVGGNFIKHYSKKIANPSLSKEELHQNNAEDIYESLSQLKGSALKVAQMMSMDKNLLPRAYAEKFTMSQYSAPPLSAPLVIKTFRTFFGKSPSELFDKFELKATYAASIGQVHEAWKNEKKLAVKVQYPGVADAVSSDLRMARPLAVSLLNMNDAEIERYFVEVETKLLEETDYQLELRRSVEISKACSQIPHLYFPNYYPELSSKRILTMDWLEGSHLRDFMATKPSQEIRNQLGQALWDFYDFQVHTLRQVHADPHPGNFLMTKEGELGIIDFGCVKEIPDDFYEHYFALLNDDTLANETECTRIFRHLEFILKEDSAKGQQFFTSIFKQMIFLLSRPFSVENFDFSDDAYFQEIYQFAEKLSKIQELKTSKVARGSQHGLYINRTYFGLYSLLNELKVNINTTKPNWIISKKLQAEMDILA